MSFFDESWLKKAIAKALTDDFAEVMQSNCVNGRFKLLPSEAAAITARKYSVSVEDVLIAHIHL